MVVVCVVVLLVSHLDNKKHFRLLFILKHVSKFVAGQEDDLGKKNKFSYLIVLAESTHNLLHIIKKKQKQKPKKTNQLEIIAMEMQE